MSAYPIKDEFYYGLKIPFSTAWLNDGNHVYIIFFLGYLEFALLIIVLIWISVNILCKVVIRSTWISSCKFEGEPFAVWSVCTALNVPFNSNGSTFFATLFERNKCATNTF